MRRLTLIVAGHLTGLPANGGFYFQAFDGSVTLPVAGYNYNSVWTPCMGLLKSSIYFTPFSTSFLHSSFFVRLGIPFLRPDPRALRSTRAGPVKVGRRSALAARSVVSRPRLDRAEHGDTRWLWSGR